MSCIKQWLSDHYLQLNSDKTKALITDPERSVPQIKQDLCAKPSLRNAVIFDSAMSSRERIRNSFFHSRHISKQRILVLKSELEMIVCGFYFIALRLF